MTRTATPKSPCACGRPAVARGRCPACYGAWRRSSAWTRAYAEPAPHAVCAAPGCLAPVKARGLCWRHLQAHYRAERRAVRKESTT